jgi:hypothetical protein
MDGFPNDPFRLCIILHHRQTKHNTAWHQICNMELLCIRGKKLTYTKTANTAATDISQIGPYLLPLQINHHEESKVGVGEGNWVVGVAVY